jgi:tryptophan synthase beta chain
VSTTSPAPSAPLGPLSSVPDALGRFGRFGGRYVPETLSAALEQLERAYEDAIADPAFAQELDGLLAAFVGRPTPLLFAERLTKLAGGAQIYF